MKSSGNRTAPPGRTMVAWLVAVVTTIAGLAFLSPAASANHTGTNTLQVTDVTVTECNAGTTPANFVIELHRAAGDTRTVTVDFATQSGSAVAGSDFQPETGTVTFAPGADTATATTDTRTVTVNVICDTVVEANEQFFLNLTNPTNAAITDAQGVGTIVNDDFAGAPPPGPPAPAPTTPAPTGTGTPAPTGSATPTPTGSATPAPTGTATPPPPTGTGTPAPTRPPGQANCTVGVPGSIRLDINVPGRRITAGNAPTLSGTVFNTSNQPCASTAIVIFQKVYGRGAGYTRLATVSTDQNGRFVLSVRPLVQTSYGANTENGAVRSNVVTVIVHTRVNITSPALPSPITSARSVANPVTFTGNLVPGYGNAAVGLGVVQNGVFRVLAQTRTTSTGNYALTARLPRGTAQYVIFVSALSQGNARGAKSILLRVS